MFTNYTPYKLSTARSIQVSAFPINLFKRQNSTPINRTCCLRHVITRRLFQYPPIHKKCVVWTVHKQSAL